jgi:hypothetical protein
MAETSTILAIILACVLVVVTVLGFTGVIPTPPMTGKCEFPNMVCRWGKMFGIPDFFLSNRNFIFYFLMPLGALGTIVYGFLTELRLFHNTKVHVLLSVFITLTCIPTQVISMLAATMLTILGAYSVGAFVVVFGVGVFIVSKGTLYDTRRRYKVFEVDLEKKMREIDTKIDRLHDQGYLRRNFINLVDADEEIRRLEEKKAKYKLDKDHLKTMEKIEHGDY